MRFDQLRLYEAVYRVRQQLQDRGESVSTDEWITKEEKRVELTRMVIAEMQRHVNSEVIDAWSQFRKSGTVGENIKKLDLTIQVWIVHGGRCFYANRGVGRCSDDVTLDRLKPESRGGTYTVENCVLACGRHNSARSNHSIEDFLK